MPAMSAAEAAETLTFIDHPFYVFRNEVSQWVYYILLYIKYKLLYLSTYIHCNTSLLYYVYLINIECDVHLVFVT